ncbi:MAG: hypothetical protein DVB27_10890 [Verrucomicrobia bacterium]|nr:MAG: hypothetical protein DVB27_10890 [Verrucomicrobiota bacterium]
MNRRTRKAPSFQPPIRLPPGGGIAIADALARTAPKRLVFALKRWRGPFPGPTTDVNIPITILGDHLPTAPYNPAASFICPKSATILAKGVAKLATFAQVLAPANLSVARSPSRPEARLTTFASPFPPEAESSSSG